MKWIRGVSVNDFCGDKMEYWSEGCFGWSRGSPASSASLPVYDSIES